MFDETLFYLVGDDRLHSAIAPASTMAKWRMRGVGPAYVKLGRRVAYSGRDLNEWIEKQTVRPGQDAAA